jgi:alpha-aminoadipic semialdehyde synthase
MVEPKK